MVKLSKKEHWDNLQTSPKIKYSSIKYLLSYSAQNYELLKIIKKYIKKKYVNFIEIGCAPGTFLIRANKKLKLKPVGVDYSKKGIINTKKNFKLNDVNTYELYNEDILNKAFIKKHKNKYDVVFSCGFIEHFEDYDKIMKIHTAIAKKGGLVVVSIPNLKYINTFFTIDRIKKICNLNIMSKEYLIKHAPKNTKILFCNYYGGLFNIGVFYFDNKFAELIRKGVFIFQRIFIDPIFILLSSIGLSVKSKYSSPQIVIVLEVTK